MLQVLEYNTKDLQENFKNNFPNYKLNKFIFQIVIHKQIN